MDQSDSNVTHTTEEYYGGIIQNLSRRVAGQGLSISVQTLCHEVLRRDLKGASRRAYRAAILAHYNHSDEAKNACDEILKSDVTRSSKKNGHRPKSGISEASLLAVADVLREKRGRWKFAERCLCLIVATNTLGLRPCEWADVEWVDDTKTVLRVRNGKFKDEVAPHGLFKGERYRRANGTHREIMLPENHADLLREVISDAIDAEIEYPWAQHKRSIRRAHDDAKKLAVRYGNITASEAKHLYLYGYRHSASAAAKSSLDLFAGEVAALLGHRSITTAQNHYAKRKTAKGRLELKPSQESIERVADRLQNITRDHDNDEVIESNESHEQSYRDYSSRGADR